MPDYFHNKLIDLLIDADLTAEDFRDDTLGCCLDDLYTAGVTEVFHWVAFQVLQACVIRSRVVYLDSNSLHLHRVQDVRNRAGSGGCYLRLFQGASFPLEV